MNIRPGPILAMPFVLLLGLMLIPLAICIGAIEWLWPELKDGL